MKLAAQIVVIFVFGVAVVASANAYFAIQRETAMFEREAMRDVEQLAAALEDAVQDKMKNADAQKTPNVRSDDKAMLSADKYVARMNVKVPAWDLGIVWRDRPPSHHRGPRVPVDRMFHDGERPLSIVWAPHDGDDNALFVYFWFPVNATHHSAADASSSATLESDPMNGASDQDKVADAVETVADLEVESELGLEFVSSMEELEEYTRGTIWRTVIFMFAVVAVSGTLMALAGVVLVGRPLKKLTEKARRAGAGDLSGPVRLRRGDELAELARALNQMCDNLGASQSQLQEETARRIAALEQLRHADRLRTVGRLASGIAHELGTPLNVVSGRAGLIASGKLTETQIAESANSIKTEAQKMTETVRGLLDFARRKPPQKAEVDLRQLVSQTVELISTLAEKHRAEVSLVPSEKPCRALVDVGQLQQVLTNLLVNAFQSMPEGGKVVVDVKSEISKPPDRTGRPAQSCHRIDIRDSGRGIPPVDLEHLFEPFFTTKDVGEGTGLGLAIAEGIVHEHGGWIEVESQEGTGSCFSVFLPEEKQS